MEKDVSLGSHNIEEQQQEGTTLASMVVPATWKRKKEERKRKTLRRVLCIAFVCGRHEVWRPPGDVEKKEEKK